MTRRIKILAVVLLGLVCGLTFWYRTFDGSPLPPEIDPTNVDPAVIKAIAECRERVLRSKQTAKTWGNLGMVLSVHDFTDEAEVCFREAERLDSAEPRWPYFQGVALIKNDPVAAIPKLRKAVELAGTMTTPRLRLAKVLTELGQFDEAQTNLRIVAQSEPDNPWAPLGLGRLYLERGELNDSLLALKAPSINSSTQKAARTMRLSIFSQLEDLAAAKIELAELAELPDDPAMPDPWVREMNRTLVGLKAMLSQINQMLESGKGNEAAQLLFQTVERYPQSEEAWRFAGQILLKANDLLNAEAAWRNVLERAPNSVVAHYNLGVTLYRQGKHKNAAPLFLRCTILKPDHGMAHYFFGSCLEQEKEYSRALLAFRQAARCQPQNFENQVALGEALARDGKQGEAVAALERAMMLRPNEASVRERLAKIRPANDTKQ